MGVQIPPWEGANFGGENGRPIVKYRDTTVVCAKTAELIGMPFGLWVRMGRRNHVRWGSIGAEGRCHGNQFWAAVSYNWLWQLMGHNFGCMIASDTQFDSRLGVGFGGQAIR